MRFPYITILLSIATISIARAGEILKHRQINDCTRTITASSGDTCISLAAYFGLTSNQFMHYNPSINSDCSNLSPGAAYCVEENHGRPSNGLSPTQTGVASNCNRFYLVQQGDTCQNIVNGLGSLTLNDLYVSPHFEMPNTESPRSYKWNPAVGTSCNSLIAGYYVCVGVNGHPTRPSMPSYTSVVYPTPTPFMPGAIGNCRNWYLVVSGDTCDWVTAKTGVSFPTIRQLNTGVNSACTNLPLGDYICIGI
jgi:LysM domain